jgi:hypothetical protein
MSLQHDVKRYGLFKETGMEGETIGEFFVEQSDGEYVLFTDYEAVRGEVERLTAFIQTIADTVSKLPSVTGLSPVKNVEDIPLAIRDLQAAYADAARARNGQYTKSEARAEAAEAEVERLNIERLEIKELIKTDSAIDREWKDENLRQCVSIALNAIYWRNKQLETAEASLRSLRDALEKLVTWDKEYPKGIVMNMGRFDESERVLDAICEEARNALTPAAPDSTKSTESTAARKDKE